MGRWGTTDDFTTSFPSFFSVRHCPLGLCELQACPFPDVVGLIKRKQLDELSVAWYPTPSQPRPKVHLGETQISFKNCDQYESDSLLMIHVTLCLKGSVY